MNHPAAVDQIAETALLIRPASFGFNEETAGSNVFQHRAVDPSIAARKATLEFDAFANALSKAGIRTCLYRDTSPPVRPDAVFPGNWVSFHHDGRVVLYPMRAFSRRLERRQEIIEDLVSKHCFQIREWVDLTDFEGDGRFLEGTGSLVLDHRNRLAFACRSERTHGRVLEEFARRLDYQPILFDALDGQGRPIYHTDVMMCIGDGFAVVAQDCIQPDSVRRQVTQRLNDTGREVIGLGTAQVKNFGGNMLNMRSTGGESIIVLSQRANDCLTPDQKEKLEANGSLLSIPLPTIENLGGGSARCMIAEIFLPSAGERLVPGGTDGE